METKSANYTLTEKQIFSLESFCIDKWGVAPRILVSGFMGHLGEDGDGWQFGALVGITLDLYKDGKLWEFPFVLHSYKGGDWRLFPADTILPYKLNHSS